MERPDPRAGEDADGAVGDLARRRYAAMVARLVRALGPARLELCEDVVQEAFVRALRAWPATGMPREPERWLFRVAKNLAIDGLRRRSLGERAEAELEAFELGRAPAATADGADPDEPAADDTLRMMFLCAHPALAPESRTALVLKSVCGLGNAAIAAALLAKEATVAQRLTRAKARLAEQRATFEMPSSEELPERLEAVLEALYFLFNEGYRAHGGDALVRVDLVHEAARLAQLLARHPATARPAVDALVALMFLQGARLPARVGDDGELRTLAEQDRSLWDARWIAAGMHHLRRSVQGDRLTAYHVEAAIAATHAGARDYASTDWPRILGEYDRLLRLRDDPVVRLNRAVAVAKVRGSEAALREVDELGDERALAAYHLRLATRAHLAWDVGDHGAAERALVAALELPCTEPERRLLERRLAACRRGEPAPAW